MKNKQWINQLSNSSHIGILVVDRKRNNLFVNPRLCEMFGYEEKFLLSSTAEVFHVNHDTFLKFADLAFDAVLEGTPLGIDYQFKKQDGTLFWVHISGDSIKSNNEVLWTMVDVTARIEAKEAEAYQFNMLNTVINSTPDLIFYKDYLNDDGEYIGCNDAFVSFVGKNKTEIIGHDDITIFGQEVGNFFRTKDKEMLDRNKTVINEEWVDYPNGDRVLLNTSKTPLRDKNNNAIGVVGISRDITAIYNSNQNIKDLNERLELALYGSHDGLWDWNILTNEVYYSPRWKEIIGYGDDELPNDLSTWKDRVHPDDIQAVMDAIKDNLNGKTEYMENRHRMKHKDGSWVWILDRGKTIFDENSKAIRMLGTHTDITHEKAIELKLSQQAQMIEQIHDSVISTDMEGIIISFNHGAEVLLEYSSSEIIGSHITKIYLEEDFEQLYKDAEVLKKDGEYHSEVRLVKKSKEIIDADLSLSLLRDEKGKPIGTVGYSQDITLRKKAQEKLKQERKYFQSIIDGVDDPIMVIKEDYTVELMNSVLKKSIANMKIADKEHPKCYEISHNRSIPCDGLDHPCPLKDVLQTKKHTTVVHNHKTKDGDDRYIELSASPLFDKEKNCIGIIESARDITSHLDVQNELREQKNILYHQAHHDTLTGLPNRVLLNDRLLQAIEKARRNSSKFALFFIDLDHFKEINDSLGHIIGDKVLKTVTSRLKETIRDEDTLARLGGDEFVIILEELNDVQDSSLIATKILEILSQSINVEDNLLYVSGSIGISVYPNDGESAQNLLKYADSAMYKAKDEGRNNYQYYNATMTELAFERVLMETNLREAIKEEQFVVYYQPQVDGTTNKLVGTEALVRWQHPTMGIVSPAKFIPLAESTGLILQIDKYVMKTAMTQVAQWYKDGLNPGVLAMNLAVKQLQQKDFIEMFQSLMKEAGCRAEWIELEVTEGQIMTNPGEAIEILNKISALGIELAVDDFGTGYSSLAYLKKLPIDKLKIDQTFVRDLPYNGEDSAITRAVIALAKSLKLKIIAEGVETKEQKEFIVENGCANIQGYFYSKPIPANELEMILKEGL